MGTSSDLDIQQAVLDIFLEVPKDLRDLPSFLTDHYEAPPEKEDKTGLEHFRPAYERDLQLAPDPTALVDSLAERSEQNVSLIRTKNYFECQQAGLRLVSSDQWPFPMAHFWFVLKPTYSGDHERPDVDGFILAALQDIFHSLILPLPTELSAGAASAVLSIVANAETETFSRIRKTWEVATRRSEDNGEEPTPDLWTVLQEHWRFSEPLSMSHMAQGINVHGVIGALHGALQPLRQAFSITIQDVKQQSYRRVDLAVTSDGMVWDDDTLLSSGRGAYYRPRAQELSMLMLLDQWTSTRIKSFRPIEREAFARISVRWHHDHPHPLRARFRQKSARQLKRLRNLISEERAVLRRAITGATAHLKGLVGKTTVFSGVEVPAYRYPRTEHGRQKTTQDGLVLELAERIQFRLETLAETTNTTSAILVEEISLQLANAQKAFTLVMTVLTVFIAGLTALLVYREFFMP